MEQKEIKSRLEIQDLYFPQYSFQYDKKPGKMNLITSKLNVDNLILMALQEDISSEDVTTNAVMREAKLGKVDLICKQDGVIAGLPVFQRVFELLDDTVEVKMYFKDGESMYEEMLNKIKDAKKYVFIETFIMSPGYMLDTLF